jgi:choline dehydrogenase-like flavoprotein
MAAAELGYPIAADVNSGLEEGFGWSDLNIVDGRRQSAADAYLAPARQRPNLTVLTDTLVHRVEVRAGRCTGVEYSVGGADGLQVADASVMPSIVSANTIATVYGIAERAAALIRAKSRASNAR